MPLSNSKNFYYVLIKDFVRCLTNKTQDHGKKHFWQYYLQCFSRSKVLECHTKNCLVISCTKSVLFTVGRASISCQNFKRSAKAPFLTFDNFECVLISSTDYIDFGPSAKNYYDRIVCSYGYKLICVDGQYSKPCKFLNDMIEENECCSKAIEI